MISKSDIYKLKKTEALSLLRQLNLSETGQRPDLLKRLMNHYYSSETKTNIKESSINTNSNMNTKKVLSKSEIRLMSKNDLINVLKNLNLPTHGKKDDLVFRAENYYRPKTENSQEKEMNEPKVPSKTDLRKLTKPELMIELEKFSLNTNGSRLELFNRLNNYYRPENKTEEEKSNTTTSFDCVDELVDSKECDDQKSCNDDITLQIIEYDGVEIGVCQDTGKIYELDENKHDWYLTKLVWDHENGCPKGFQK